VIPSVCSLCGLRGRGVSEGETKRERGELERESERRSGALTYRHCTSKRGEAKSSNPRTRMTGVSWNSTQRWPQS
jgi:hypothetical protein